MTRVLYDVKETARLLSVSVNTVRNLIAAGKLRSVKIGSSRRVPATAIEEFTKNLMKAA
ncbi:helix-turn-helix domain-containing protein [Streptomyces sp. WAC00469]|uniref:helix-turn-helix domain-containing protein n=1 Tax=Streptomyces sp. WAC00469 TaxID=2487415 RepID=UPI000F7406BE|nr:helix-turn-helix domain-containing protein [Streptomyces sp. WAC00469]RSS04102.1 DNA-binding protein [Streptomyces sp. WAC00469]